MVEKNGEIGRKIMERLFTLDPKHLKIHKQHLVYKVLLAI
jgi:hypothetical protein